MLQSRAINLALGWSAQIIIGSLHLQLGAGRVSARRQHFSRPLHKLDGTLMLLQEDSARKQEAERRAVAEQIEAERRATEQYKASLDKEVQAARAMAEAEGRIKENRANEDINRRRGVWTWVFKTGF